jgi:anti-sigma regulatory factor (Ser/Thr protein kinase)
MIDSMSAADVANAERFERIGIAADAESAGRTRKEFAQWLEEYFDLDPIRSSDLVLATNEALANAAEFAYLLADRPGTMDIHAMHHPDRKLTVTVSDNGTWRIPNPAPPNGSRGHGIPLMRALTDRTTIETSTGGTQVCLEWAGVQPRLRSAQADGSA